MEQFEHVGEDSSSRVDGLVEEYRLKFEAREEEQFTADLAVMKTGVPMAFRKLPWSGNCQMKTCGWRSWANAKNKLSFGRLAKPILNSGKSLSWYTQCTS